MYGSFGTDERKGSKAIILLTPEETFSFPPKDAVVKAKLAGFKGTYIQRVAVFSTMGPGVKVEPGTLLG